MNGGSSKEKDKDNDQSQIKSPEEKKTKSRSKSKFRKKSKKIDIPNTPDTSKPPDMPKSALNLSVLSDLKTDNTSSLNKTDLAPKSCQDSVMFKPLPSAPAPSMNANRSGPSPIVGMDKSLLSQIERGTDLKTTELEDNQTRTAPMSHTA